MLNSKKANAIAWLMASAPVIGHAAGLAITEQNASRLGNAYAGGAAEAGDASVIFYNPAGLTALKGRQLSISGLAFFPRVVFNNNGSTSPAGTPVTGGNGGNGASTEAVPNLYYADSTGNGLRYGIGISAPAGVGMDYGPAWAGRYYSVESSLQVVNISPAVATRIGPRTSIGAALDIQYARAKLTKAIDFGSLCFAGAPAAFCASQGLLPQQADGMAAVKGHDWSVGYHLGLQHELGADTRIGFQYRSKVTHTIDGSGSFANVPAFIAPGFQNTRARADITLPEVVSVSGTHKLTPAITIMSDVSWTRWSRFKELRIRFDAPPPTGDDVTLEDWRNSWRFAFGVNYRHTEQLTWRTGVSYEQGPVRGGLRTPAIPDGTRAGLAFGANYRISGNSSIDIGYAHIFVPDGGVNLSSPQQGTLNGHFRSRADILGVQYNHGF